MPTPTPKSILVIGGGIIGAASAYSLAKAGLKVTLVDQGAFGSGCSHANCGYVSPSHVLPLCTPGAVGKTLKFALRPNSPFRIAPRLLDFKLWKFLAQFALNCDDKKAVPAGFARKAMIERSTVLYKQFLANENLDCQWEDKGCIFTNETAEGFKDYSGYVAQLQDTFKQEGWVKLEGGALTDYEPAIKPGALAGGWLFKGDAQMKPDQLMDCYKTALLRLGVDIQEHTKITGLRKENGRVVAAQTDGHYNGDIAADAFVVATGAWTPLLSKDLGFAVPIQPGKGYSITMTKPAICPATPLIFQDVKVAISPFKDAYRIGSLMEFAGYDTSMREERLQLLRNGAARYLKEPMGPAVTEQWYGWRPMTPTGKPVIGFAPGANNLVVAAGHNMEGMCMGAATGEMVMELATGQKTTVNSAPFAA